MDQGTDEWLAKRAGCFTASRMAALMARTKSGPAASRKNMITTLAIERLTGEPVSGGYTNAAMQRGLDLEPEARDAYAFEYGVVVDEVAYLDHPELERVGCSPDGLIGDDGMIEIKCPDAMAKHLDALRSGAHATEYRWQLQHQLFVSRRAWVDAVSYDPRYPAGMQLAVKRVFANAEDQADLAAEIAKSDAEINKIVNELKTIREAKKQ